MNRASVDQRLRGTLSRWPQSLDRLTPRAVGLVALAYGALLATIYITVANGSAGTLIHAGEPITDGSAAPSWLPVGGPEDSYDGQYFFRLAIAPFSLADRVAGVEFDLPAYRAGRVGYPLVGKVLALGADRVVPWTLVLANVLAFGAIGAVGASLARRRDRPAWWAFAIVLYPGFAITLARDLSEICAVALALGGLLAFERSRPVLGAGLLIAASLTRETTTLVIVAVLLHSVVHLQRKPARSSEPRRNATAAGVALVVVCAWQVLNLARWGELPVLSGSSNVQLPAEGALRAWRSFWPPTNTDNAFRLVALALLASVLMVGARACVRSASLGVEHLVFIGAAIQVVTMGELVYVNATGFLRGSTEMFVFAVISAWSVEHRAGARRSWPAVRGVALAGTTLLTIGAELTKLT